MSSNLMLHLEELENKRTNEAQSENEITKITVENI